MMALVLTGCSLSAGQKDFDDYDRWLRQQPAVAQAQVNRESDMFGTVMHAQVTLRSGLSDEAVAQFLQAAHDDLTHRSHAVAVTAEFDRVTCRLVSTMPAIEQCLSLRELVRDQAVQLAASGGSRGVTIRSPEVGVAQLAAWALDPASRFARSGGAPAVSLEGREGEDLAWYVSLGTNPQAMRSQAAARLGMRIRTGELPGVPTRVRVSQDELKVTDEITAPQWQALVAASTEAHVLTAGVGRAKISVDLATMEHERAAGLPARIAGMPADAPVTLIEALPGGEHRARVMISGNLPDSPVWQGVAAWPLADSVQRWQAMEAGHQGHAIGWRSGESPQPALDLPRAVRRAEAKLGSGGQISWSTSAVTVTLRTDIPRDDLVPILRELRGDWPRAQVTLSVKQPARVVRFDSTGRGQATVERPVASADQWLVDAWNASA